APLRSFSSANQGNGFLLTCSSQLRWSFRKDLYSFALSKARLQYACTSISAQSLEKEVSVAPSATANLKASTPSSTCRLGQKASSYSSMLFPSLGSQNAWAKMCIRLSKTNVDYSDVYRCLEI